LTTACSMSRRQLLIARSWRVRSRT
jgi:hypothetical protein